MDMDSTSDEDFEDATFVPRSDISPEAQRNANAKGQSLSSGEEAIGVPVAYRDVIASERPAQVRRSGSDKACTNINR